MILLSLCMSLLFYNNFCCSEVYFIRVTSTFLTNVSMVYLCFIFFFNLPMTFRLKCISCKWHRVGICFFIPTLSISVFQLAELDIFINIDLLKLKLPLLLVLSCSHSSVSLYCFLVSYWNFWNISSWLFMPLSILFV